MKYILIGIILVAALAYLIDTLIRWLRYRKERRRSKSGDIYMDSAKRYASLYGECKEVGQPIETVFIHKDYNGRTHVSDTFKDIPSVHEGAESWPEAERKMVNDDTLDAMRYAALWAQESQAQSSSMDYYLGAEAAPSPGFEGFGGGDFSGGGASGDWGSSDTGSADAGGSFGND